MALFRKQTPQRRTTVKSKANYQDYKDELQEDFNFRCGYCNDFDKYKDRFYEIDHFVPHQYCKVLKANSYSNLVYTCRYCNNAKSNKFPTQDENKHHDGTVGFIDPCDSNYAEQFERERGRIIPKTALGRYMWKEMNLGLLRHELVHNLERIDNAIEQLRKLNLPKDHEGAFLLSQLYTQSWEIVSRLRE